MGNKSFRLKPNLSFYQSRQRFWIGLLCGIGMVIALFLFQLMLLQCSVYLAREFHNALIVIPAQQLQWFVGFFAAVAFLGGSSVAFMIWLQRHRTSNRGRKFWLNMAINDQSNVLPSFFYVYFKLTFVIFIWFLSYQWVYTTNVGLPTILKALIILLPIVLLLNQWVNLRRYFEVKPYWILLHLCFLAATSFSLSFLNLPMETNLKAQFVKERPYLNLNIQYPTIACDDETKSYYNEGLMGGDWYLGFDSGIMAKPIVNFHKNLPDSSYIHSNWGHHALYIFHFDAKLPMAAVDSFVLNYRKTKVRFFEGHKALLLCNCSNKPDRLALKPYSFLTFRFISCDPEKNLFGNPYRSWIALKIMANGKWMLKDEVYTEEKLWEVLATEELKWIMLTYEPTTPLNEVLKAYVYLNKLKRPLDWKGYDFYYEKGIEIPQNRFGLSIWFLSMDICLQQAP